MVIPFLNKTDKEPIILNTVFEDNKIFKMIDNCFSDKPTIFENIINTLYDIRYNKFVKNVSLSDNHGRIETPSSSPISNGSNSSNRSNSSNSSTSSTSSTNYLPVIYHNNYKYSIAKNNKELQKINSTEMNFYFAEHNIRNYDKFDYGFIVFWIQNTNTPLAVLTNIEDNKFFVPTKDFYLYTFFDKVNIKQVSSDIEYGIPQYSSQYVTNVKHYFTNIKDIPEENVHESTDSSGSNENVLEYKYINYKIYILHTCNGEGNNANTAFNSNITNDCTFGKYIKSCSSKKMFKMNMNKTPNNLWFNVANNTNPIII
jgi:hypothetical protein